MSQWKHYHTPETIPDSLKLLEEYQGKARIIAGGTDLMLELKYQDHSPPEALIDITRINHICEIEERDDALVIGAGVTHTKIISSELLAKQATCLVESCGVIGGPQVRNVGTLGGNVVQALPAGDGTTSLVALNAQVEIIKDGNHQEVNILDMYTGPGKSLLDPTQDICLKFNIPKLKPGEASAFARVMRPQGVALPILGCAVWLALDDAKEKIADVRICIGPVAPTPTRAVEVEEMLKGNLLTEEVLSRAADTARKHLKPRTSKYRATSAYRLEMIEMLLRKTLPLAYHRAQTGEVVPEGIGLQ